MTALFGHDDDDIKRKLNEIIAHENVLQCELDLVLERENANQQILLTIVSLLQARNLPTGATIHQLS